MTTLSAELPCGYVFAISGGRCGASAGHAVHVGGWTGPEPRHDYKPEERRSGGDRRAATLDAAPSIDVEALVRDERNPYDEGSAVTSEAMLAIGFEKARAAILARLTESAPQPVIRKPTPEEVEAARQSEFYKGYRAAQPAAPETERLTDGLVQLITSILRKYGGTMKGRGDHDIYDALVRYRAAIEAGDGS